MLYNIIIIIQVISALAIIALVLMQQGKGADMGAAFGAGSSGSGSLFGAQVLPIFCQIDSYCGGYFLCLDSCGGIYRK